MKKKGLVAMGLAGVMTIGMCVPVLAADADLVWENSTSAKDSKNATTVTGDVASTYTVTIPNKITEDELVESGLQINASNLNLEESKSIKVSVNNEKVVMKLKADSVTEGTDMYNISLSKDGTTALGNSDLTAAEFTGENKTGSSTLKAMALSKADTLKAGAYSGTVTFTIIYE